MVLRVGADKDESTVMPNHEIQQVFQTGMAAPFPQSNACQDANY